jgi:hypothetical protein
MPTMSLRWKAIPGAKPLSPKERAVFVTNVIREVAAGCEVNNYVLQGALRLHIPGVPAEQDYTKEMGAAVEAGWLEKLGPDRYLRIRPAHHWNMRDNIEELKLRVEAALCGQPFLD